MPVRHRLTDADTLESIAFKYFGEEGPFRIADIIEYNNLVSPYISTDNDDKYIPYAKGYVYVRRENPTSAVTIKKNWSLKTKQSIINFGVKTYYVTEDVTIPAGTYEGYIPVRSAIPGLQGNTIANTLQVLGSEFERHYVDFAVVTNVEPINSGLDGKVLTTGDYLFIPAEEDEVSDAQNDGVTQAHYYYGEDIMLSSEDDIVIASGDIATVNFLENVKQAVVQRLKAERGDNPYDQDWGTDIHLLIGNSKIPYEVLPKRIGIEIYRTLSFEDRVYEPNVVSVDIDKSKGVAYVNLDMKVVNLDQVLEIRGLVIGGSA